MAAISLMDALRTVRRSSSRELETMARCAGVPFHTLRKIATGETRDPRLSTIEAVQRYLCGCEVQWPAAHDEQEAA